jgi:HD-like signal output (HDOD) protein
MKMEAVLSLPFVMPSTPRVVAQLMIELTRTEHDLRRIDQLICMDPGLTIRLLQAANSGAFNLSGQIHSVAEALAVLRLAQVQVMVAEATSSANFKSVPGILLPQFWAYSLDVAKVSRSLAGLVRQNQQAAYTCGLIHAVGELMLRMATPKAVALDNVETAFDLKRARAERRVFGFCYTKVSAALARQWYFPQIMIDALEYQYAPFENEVYEPLAGVVHLAIWRARVKHAGLLTNALTVTFPSAVGEVLGLDMDMVLQQDPIDWSAQVPGRPLLGA